MKDRYGYTKEYYLFPLLTAGIVVGAAALVAIIAYGIVFPLERRECNINAANLGTEAKHVNWVSGNGCFLLDDGKWIPQNQYRKAIG